MFRVLLSALLLAGATACAPAGRTDGESDMAVARAGGPELEMATAESILDGVRASGAPVVVLNVWATWCIPCREEFPDLLRLRADYADQGVELVLVSADFDDQADEAKAFLAENGVDWTTFMKQQKDMAFIDGMNPEWSGALPASFVYDADGELHYFHEGKITYDLLEAQVLDVLNEQRPN